MPPFVSASKAVGRLISRKGGIGLLRRTAKSSVQFEKFVQVRCLSSIMGIGTPSADKMIGSNRDFSFPLQCMNNTFQTRCFLGCGDGEEGSALSKIYEEKRVIGYSPEQLFAVVAAVDMYEDFLPWCQRSEIIQRIDDGTFDAELEIGFKFLVESYISHVELKKPKSIKTTASESGVFDHLINIWEFNPGPVPGTCNLHFFVDFKFKSPLYRQVALMFFKEVVARLVGSFDERCRLIYGPGVQVLKNSYGGQKA